MLKVVTVIMAIIIILAGALVLRLSMGPMSIAFLDTAIRNPLKNALPNIEVSFEEPSLYWNRREDSLDLQLSKVVFSRPNGEVIANSPFVGLAISNAALLDGKVHPTRLDLIGPELELKWRALSLMDKLKNNDRIISGPAQMMQAQEQPPLLSLVQALMGNGEIDGPLGQLASVSIMDGDIWLEEVDSGERWHLPKTRMQFLKGAGGLNLSVDINLEALGTSTELQVRTLSNADGDDVVRFNFGELNVSKLASSVGLDGFLLMLDMPIFGMATLTFDKDGLPKTTVFNIGGGQGQVHIPELYSYPPQLDQMELSGVFVHGDKTLRIDKLNISLGEAEASIDGMIRFITNSKPELNMFINVKNMPIKETLYYWPERFARGAHNWVYQHTEDGILDEANLVFAIKPNYWGQRPLPEDALHIDFRFSDLTAHYLRPLPPLIHADGSGVVTPNNLSIDVVRGETDGIKINPSNLTGENLGYPELRRGFVTFSLDTTVPKLLAFIDQDPINRNRSYSIDPNEFSGQARTSGSFDFPLAKGNTFADVNMDVEVVTTDAAIPNLMYGGGLSNANLNILVNKDGIAATGNIEVKGVPMTLKWDEAFVAVDEDTPRSRYEVSGDITPEHLLRFGVPAVGRMDGTARVNMVINANGKDLIDGEGTVDLINTQVFSPKLAWWKNAGSDGNASFAIKWTGDTFWLQDLVVDSKIDVDVDEDVEVGRFSAQATMHFDKRTGRLLEAYIPRIQSYGHDLSMAANLSIDNYIELLVDADNIDLSSFLDDLIRGQKGLDYIPEALIIINARHATALNGVALENFKIDAWNSGGYWATSDMRGQFVGGEGEGGEFSLLLRRQGEGRNIEIKSDNAGQLALAAGLFLNGNGGQLNLTAELGGPENADEIAGSLFVEDFRIVKSAPFISALSNTHGFDVDSMIGENGMEFKELSVPFTISNGIIDISDAKANGPSMGFTMEGQVNQRTKQLNLNGLIVPAFSLNSILGKIPLIGGLLGGKDGGLFALSYRIEGEMGNTDFTFNPLSAIAPGFLRKIFEGRKGTVEIDHEELIEDTVEDAIDSITEDDVEISADPEGVLF